MRVEGLHYVSDNRKVLLQVIYLTFITIVVVGLIRGFL